MENMFKPSYFLVWGLFLLCGLAHAQTVQVSSTGMSATSGAKVLWSVPDTPYDKTLEVRVVAPRVLRLSRGEQGIKLAAYSLSTGKRLWQRPLWPQPHENRAYLAGTLGRAALIIAGAGNVQWRDVGAYDLATGAQMWRSSGEIVGQVDDKVLLLAPSVDNANINVSPNGLPLLRAAGSYGPYSQPLPLGFTISARVGCGMVQYQTAYPDIKVNGRFITALRKDKCGYFSARFDWLGKFGQNITLGPKK